MRTRPSDVLSQNRELIRNIVLSHKSSNPRIFGSVLRGTDTEESDLDLLIEQCLVQAVGEGGYALAS